MTRLRDDAVGKPGAHADGAAAREGGRGRGDLPQMGPRLRRSSATPPTICASASCISGEEVANLPIKDLGDQAPEYDRPWVEPTKPAPLAADDMPHADVADALLKLLGGPDLSSRRWVWEQYDTLIQGNSLQRPGGDAGVVRVDGHPTKALAFSSDVTPRYCEADPYEGGKQAVAECWRNLTATGAEPLAATDNLNFGNPERPEIMGQLVRARSKASARPAGRSTSRSSPAMSRSTTRPTAGHPADADDRRRRPARRLVEDGAHRLRAPRTRRSCWSARRPAGARISASRSICATSMAAPTARRRRSTSRMRRRVGDFVRALIAARHRHRRARSLRRRPCRGAGRNGDGLGHRRRQSRQPAGRRSDPAFFGEDQGRYLVDGRPRSRRRTRCGGFWTRPRRSASSRPGSARPAAAN